MSLLSHILLELARRSCWRTLPISTGRTRSRAPQRTWRLAVDKLNSWRWGDLHGLRAARSIGMPLQFSLFGSRFLQPDRDAMFQITSRIHIHQPIINQYQSMPGSFHNTYDSWLSWSPPQVLLDAGASCSEQDGNGHDVAMLALRAADESCVTCIRQRGATVFFCVRAVTHLELAIASRNE